MDIAHTGNVLVEGEIGHVGLASNVDNCKDDLYKKPYAEKLLFLYEGQTAPLHYHWSQIWLKPGESVLLGEVSMCNDDNIDNRFYEPIGRFPKIEEDEVPYRLLCNEYPLIS